MGNKECSAIKPNQLMVNKLMAEQFYYKVCHHEQFYYKVCHHTPQTIGVYALSDT